MAYTKFVSDLNNAIITDNRSKIASLLNAATSSTWSAAGTDISAALTYLSRSKLSPTDIANFAKTIVEKGTVDSYYVSAALNDFIAQDNYAATKLVLNAASPAELSSSPLSYGNILNDVATSHMTDAQKADLAQLLVTKTVVNSDHVSSAVSEFIAQDNYAAATLVLKAASTAELASSPLSYGNILNDVATSRMTDAQKADLAQLLVSKTSVNSDHVSSAVSNFIFEDNFAATKLVLNAAATSELKSSPLTYGNILNDISSSHMTAAQKAELAQLLVTKTAVNSDHVSSALNDFILQDNFAAVKLVLNAVATSELTSSPLTYGNILNDISSSHMTAAQKAELAQLLVSKTSVNSDHVNSAISDFIYQENLSAIDKILSSASTAEKSKLTKALHEDIAEAGYKNGHDVVQDTAGNDVLYGYNGNDTLYGGFGKDTLTGGKGSDRFVLSDKVFQDTITDFSTKEKDVLVLSKSLFNSSESAIDSAINDFVIARTVGNNTIISIDADGKGAGKSIDIALMQNVTGIDVDVLHHKGLIDIA